jgi:DNA polymerase
MSERDRRANALLEVFSRWDECKKCPLHETRTQIVFPDGNPSADIVVIGISPGEDEDADGAPFVGDSGFVIDDYCKEVRVRKNDMFYMNIVSCRPFSTTRDSFGKKRTENREPSLIERAACRPLWEETLYILDPLLIIAMGKPTIQEVTGQRSINMHQIQGKIKSCTVQGRAKKIVYPVMCMHHPAHLMRSGDIFKGGPWHQTLVAWQRAIYFVDRMRNLYWGEEMPERPFTTKDLFATMGSLPK